MRSPVALRGVMDSRYKTEFADVKLSVRFCRRQQEEDCLAIFVSFTPIIGVWLAQRQNYRNPLIDKRRFATTHWACIPRKAVILQFELHQCGTSAHDLILEGDPTEIGRLYIDIMPSMRYKTNLPTLSIVKAWPWFRLRRSPPVASLSGFSRPLVSSSVSTGTAPSSSSSADTGIIARSENKGPSKRRQVFGLSYCLSQSVFAALKTTSAFGNRTFTGYI